jgi:hypothetical protein
LASLVAIFPYRCRYCGHRFLKFHIGAREEPEAPQPPDQGDRQGPARNTPEPESSEGESG